MSCYHGDYQASGACLQAPEEARPCPMKGVSTLVFSRCTSYRIPSESEAEATAHRIVSTDRAMMAASRLCMQGGKRSVLAAVSLGLQRLAWCISGRVLAGRVSSWHTWATGCVSHADGRGGTKKQTNGEIRGGRDQLAKQNIYHATSGKKSKST